MTKKNYFLFSLFSLICIHSFSQTGETTFQRGERVLEFTGYEPLKDKPITIYYYIPLNGNIKEMPILFSMHGAERGGKNQVKGWRSFAEKSGFIVLAPEYSREFYSENEYQFGGVSETSDEFKLRPEEQWTYKTIEVIFDYFKAETGNQSEKYDMYGHSGGGQFVHRYLLTTPQARVRKAIAANPGSWTFVTDEGLTGASGVTYGWPFSIKDTPFASDKYLKPFFEKDLIIHLGTADTIRVSQSLPSSEGARLQGSMRYERGENFFQQSKAEALKRGMQFNWKTMEVIGVGHSNVRMIHGKADVNSLERDNQKYYDINDITSRGAYMLLFE